MARFNIFLLKICQILFFERLGLSWSSFPFKFGVLASFFCSIEEVSIIDTRLLLAKDIFDWFFRLGIWVWMKCLDRSFLFVECLGVLVKFPLKGNNGILTILEVSDGLPSGLLERVAFPLDEIKSFALLLASLDDFLDFPLLLSFLWHINIV